MARFKFNDDNILASLDIGSSSIRSAISRKTNKGLQPISFYEKDCSGLIEEGKIKDFYGLISVMGLILETSEKMSNTSFSEVFVGFSSPFRSFRSHGMTALSSREVTKKDVAFAIQTACAIPMPNHHVSIHNQAQSFSVDQKKGIVSPVGLSGLRLETEVHIVTVLKSYIQDLTKVFKALGCTPRGFTNNLVVFGENLLDSTQKKEGVCFCDIGQKSSRLIVYFQGQVVDMLSIPWGESHFYSSVSDHFKIAPEQAQKLQRKWGHLKSYSVDDQEQVEVDGGGWFFSYKDFVLLLEESAKQLFKTIKQTLESRKVFPLLDSGFVFTGEVAFLEGFLEMARFHLEKPTSYPRETEYNLNNFKQVNTRSIAQYFYSRNSVQEFSLASKWEKFKELF